MSRDEDAGASGATVLAIPAEMQSQAERAVKAELLLEELARAEQVEVTNEDLGREIALAAARAQREPREVAKELADSGRLGAVAADIMRRKALDHVVATANVIGRPSDDDKDDEE